MSSNSSPDVYSKNVAAGPTFIRQSSIKDLHLLETSVYYILASIEDQCLFETSFYWRPVSIEDQHIGDRGLLETSVH